MKGRTQERVRVSQALYAADKGDEAALRMFSLGVLISLQRILKNAETPISWKSAIIMLDSIIEDRKDKLIRSIPRKREEFYYD